jgi:hypothetical protein
MAFLIGDYQPYPTTDQDRQLASPAMNSPHGPYFPSPGLELTVRGLKRTNPASVATHL